MNEFVQNLVLLIGDGSLTQSLITPLPIDEPSTSISISNCEFPTYVGDYHCYAVICKKGNSYFTLGRSLTAGTVFLDWIEYNLHTCNAIRTKQEFEETVCKYGTVALYIQDPQIEKSSSLFSIPTIASSTDHVNACKDTGEIVDNLNESGSFHSYYSTV